ncbi:short chain dehydrogenase [Desulfuromonas sp. DDH964]|uniref:short chain dehydrogenase n=1 Tax=Desulfuromonas sp. DDH964 TaxID=1823759 RepID=UPI00078CF722|nr:short chain dehydrogenase [Desulfuromonas sp. DDH964]AMV72323.1 short chain dehydrogenase [Desulfuromonas sp. DDH964]
MRILLIGASGTIGSAVCDLLSLNHDVIKASRSSGDLKVDISSADSIRSMYTQAGKFDAVVSAAGQARFKGLAELNDEDFAFCLTNKLMGQVNLVRIGSQFIADGGSFTLTSGILAQMPMPGSAAISLVNAGLEGFARAAALEMERRVRVNVVSPPWVRETLEKMGKDPLPGMPATQVAKAYQQSVEGSRSGEVISP